MKEERNIYQVLLEVQRELQPAKKDATNPYFRSKYADLSSVMEAIKKPLNDAGILIQQIQVADTIETHLILVSDPIQRIINYTQITSKSPNDPQSMGSAITYARRYGLITVTCLDTEDDDGNSANFENIESKIANARTLEELKEVYNKSSKTVAITKLVTKRKEELSR